ncbi:MAG: MFS transporter [Sideroxydans sp.]|nr:MFS transporter [Sideroxydans sp.]
MHTITSTQRKVVLAACFGTFLEWYDFLTFATLATYFSVLFFPPEDATAALLASLAAFGVGMIVRPLGSALFGTLADRYGRRPIFLVTISLMGGATFLVGMLPTYAQVGMLAPALLLLLRLLQGFAVGGEIGGVAVYLTEHAPDGRRGFYTSVLQLMGPLGILVSTFQIVLLHQFLDDASFSSWGWRVPFLFSVVLLFISIKTRMSLEESPVFKELQEQGRISQAPLRECFRDRQTLKGMALLFFCISAGGSLLFFTSQVYANVFLKSVVRLDAQLASTLVMLSTLLLFPLTIWCGWLSDRIGRRPVLLAGLLLGALSIIPVFKGLQHFGNPALQRFNSEVTVTLAGPDCNYSPFHKAMSECARNQEFFIKNGIVHSTEPGESVLVRIGADVEVSGFDPAALSAGLQAKGWTEKADSAQANPLMLFLLLVIPVVAVGLITGPQTAVLPELFRARTRYTAAALPHNLSAGWIGGLSPFMVTLLSVNAGDVMAGLWYPVGMLILASIIGLMFLPETKDVVLGD